MFSSVVLTDLLAGGAERESAYRLIQAAADRSAETGEPFGAALRRRGTDPGPLTPERLLTRHDVILTRLEALRGLED